MNRFEFIAIGKILFGNTWKNDLARQLNLSVKSKSIDKICRAERGITEAIEAEMIDTMRYKAEMLLRCIDQIENKPMFRVIYNNGMNLYFGESGLWHSTRIHEDLISGGALIIKNAQIEYMQYTTTATIIGSEEKFKIKCELEMQSKAIEECFKICNKNGDYNPLVDLIKSYFELPTDISKMLESYRVLPVDLSSQ